MDKVKVAKMALSIGGTVLMGVATLINNKVADEKMKEAVDKAVAKALSSKQES